MGDGREWRGVRWFLGGGGVRGGGGDKCVVLWAVEVRRAVFISIKARGMRLKVPGAELGK